MLIAKNWFIETNSFINDLKYPRVIGVAEKSFVDNPIINNIEYDVPLRGFNPFKSIEQLAKVETVDECLFIISKMFSIK